MRSENLTKVKKRGGVIWCTGGIHPRGKERKIFSDKTFAPIAGGVSPQERELKEEAEGGKKKVPSRGRRHFKLERKFGGE